MLVLWAALGWEARPELAWAAVEVHLLLEI
jgi:hypothetical protein